MDRKLGRLTTALMAIAATGLIVFATTPNAEQTKQAVGQRPCSAYTLDRAAAARTPPVDGPYPDLSPYASFVDAQNPMTLKGQEGVWLDTFCRANPDATFAQAAKALSASR